MSNWNEYSSYMSKTKTSNNVARNPLNLGEECILINSKKTQYYKYYYTQPSRIIDSLLSMYDVHDPRYKQIQDYINVLSNTFDLNDDTITPRCNCISLVLYFTDNNKIFNLSKYIPSIHQTVINVTQNLPDYVVRIYLDRSVYDILYEDDNVSRQQKFITSLRTQFEQIIDSPNVEIYTFLCSSFTNDFLPATRTLRFLPLIDNTVNTVIIREADGIVSRMDCHNIKVFNQSSKIMYLLPLTPGSAHIYGKDDYYYYAYSTWLRFYKQVIEQEYFKTKNNLYDLLAGLIGFNLKVKPNIYFEMLHQTKDKLTNYDPQFSFSKNIGYKLVAIVDKYLPYKFRFNPIARNGLVDVTMNHLKLGFDEIFLLDLFKDVISADITVSYVTNDNGYSSDDDDDNGDNGDYRVQYDPTQYDIICYVMYANHNIVEFKRDEYGYIDDFEAVINTLIDTHAFHSSNVDVDGILSVINKYINIIRNSSLYNYEQFTSLLIDALFYEPYLNLNNTQLYDVVKTLSNTPMDFRVSFDNDDLLPTNVYNDVPSEIQQYFS